MQLARSHEWTLNTLAQAAWALVLSRHLGRNDVVFGQIVGGRTPDVPGIEEMVGLFINAVPVRVQMRSSETLEHLLTRLQRDQRALEPHQYLSLAELKRLAGAGDLFDTLLIFQNFPITASGDEDERPVRITPVATHDATHYPLSVAITPGRQLTLHLSWRPDMLSADVVASLAERLERALSAIARDASQPIAAIDLLSDAERTELLALGTDTNAMVDAPSTLPAWIAAQVARTPEAIAVVEGDRHVSYAALGAHAQQLAWWLQAQGVGPETVVGVAIDRSTTLVTALLGVMAAGGAYLPLDPRYPAARLQAMVADAQPMMVLGTIATAAQLPDVPVIALDAPTVIAAIAAATPQPAPRIAGAHPAYVIYTSGSTGVPKGAPNTHAGIANRLAWMQDAYRLDATDRVLQKTPASFDVSVWEFFWPLTHGATLVLLAAGAPRRSGDRVDDDR